MTGPPTSGVEDEDSVPVALLDVLPGDAPPGHVAHTEVKLFVRHSRRYAGGIYRGDEEESRVEVPVAACRGHPEVAKRVARAMWMRFDVGATKEEVLDFRVTCCERIHKTTDGGGSGAHTAPRISGTGASMPPSPVQPKAHLLARPDGSPPSAATCRRGPGAKRRRVFVEESGDRSDPLIPETLEPALETPCMRRTTSGESTASVDSVASTAVGSSCSHGSSGTDSEWAEPPCTTTPVPLPQDPLEEDAPEGHMAHTAVKFCAHAQGHLYHFKYKGQHFQVTVGMARNSGAQAGRIARLCYLRFQAGDSKDAVRRYRNRLYEMLPKSKDMAEASGHGCPKEGNRHLNAKRSKGALGSAWYSQLGSRHSCMKAFLDPLDFL